jgi:SAM-dependent methyltransferase
LPAYDDAARFWDAKYADADYHFGTEPNAFLARQAARLPEAGQALAVADGEGRNGVWLAGRGLQVDAVDLSPRAVEKARALAVTRGVEERYHPTCADLAGWDLGTSAYDVVVAVFIQFAPPALRTRLFERMKQALVPGGLLLLEGYRPEQVDYGTGGPPHREHMYDTDLLRDAFGDLEILELTAYDAVVREGRGHDGLSALIDLVARKPAD